MTTGPDITGPTGHDPDAALTPEERALADRLARLGPQREPAPALDARILAAARAAAAAPAAAPANRRRRPRRRWPAVAGIAATLVLAVGLAWQLRPVDDTRVEYSEAPRAATARAADGGPSAVDDGAEPARESSAPLQDAVPAAQAVRAPVGNQPAVAPAAAKPQAKPAPEAEPPIVFDEPSPMDAPTEPPVAFKQAPAAPSAPPPPMAVPPAPAPQMPATSPAEAAANGAAGAEAKARKLRSPARDDASMTGAARTTTATGSFAVEAEPAKTRDEADAADARALDRVETNGSRVDRFADQPIDDQPPASADSPRVQQAWLQRIRQLVAEGRLDTARDSLREYQHRYPKAVLPDDLRALLEE